MTAQTRFFSLVFVMTLGLQGCSGGDGASEVSGASGNAAAGKGGSAGQGGTGGKAGSGGTSGQGGGGQGGNEQGGTSGAGAAGEGGEGGTGGQGACKADDACTAPLPFCDLASGQCVECLPTNDACPTGEYCSGVTLSCEPGCKSDADCTTPGGTQLTCDLTLHACVGCKGDDALCPAGQVCQGELCVPGCNAAHACPEAEICCGGSCFQGQTDVDHCGSCDACPQAAHGAVACEAGACKLTGCDAGFADCNGAPEDGCEEETTTALDHCGACGVVCAEPNKGTPKCAAGACGVGLCETGYGDCDGDPSNGCETVFNSDPAHCGSCDTVCPAILGSSPACSLGKCVFGGCSPGFFDCNKDTSDGCEIDLQSDVNNCGACGNQCPSLPNAIPACEQGVCVVGQCNDGYGDCDGSSFTGCEADLSSDPVHCGACNSACTAPPNQQPACLPGGICAGGQCAPGRDDCNQDPSDGCEAILGTDASNCGACGTVCPPFPNAAGACAGFECVMGACEAGFADCFGGATDGCETSLMNDADNCGACGTVCPAVAHATRSCDAGQCGYSACDAGFADCDGDPSNGCEAELSSDANNCAACGTVCPGLPNASGGCIAGACGIGACDAGTSDCNNNPADGCEFDSSNDPNNCGACGKKCGSGTCQDSKCTCLKTVLILADDSAAGSQVLGSALTAKGYTVAVSSVPSHQYNGTNPPLAGFGSVVLLAGGPTATSYTTDMPNAGQQALLNFVKAGNGLIFTEWASYHTANGRWKTLEPLTLLQRTSSYTGAVTFTANPAFLGHPLWAGLSQSFSFSAAVNVGLAKVGPGITLVATSPQAVNAVVIRDLPSEGRVVHVANAGNYTPNGWSNTNLQKLIGNAVGWAAQCQ